jgi:hypothetical protein
VLQLTTDRIVVTRAILGCMIGLTILVCLIGVGAASGTGIKTSDRWIAIPSLAIMQFFANLAFLPPLFQLFGRYPRIAWHAKVFPYLHLADQSSMDPRALVLTAVLIFAMTTPVQALITSWLLLRPEFYNGVETLFVAPEVAFTGAWLAFLWFRSRKIVGVD